MAEKNEYDARKKKYKELLEKEQKLVQEIKDWERKSQNTEMTLLHKYNEVKDAAQVLLGAIANIEGVTIKELHERFQLPIND